jgi:hypothetical protein
MKVDWDIIIMAELMDMVVMKKVGYCFLSGKYVCKCRNVPVDFIYDPLTG